MRLPPAPYLLSSVCALLVACAPPTPSERNEADSADGTSADTGAPATAAVMVVTAAAGAGHICALIDDGRVRCWGQADMAQTGHGVLPPAGTDHVEAWPKNVVKLSGAVALAALAKHTCALLEDATVACWGWNAHGQLGNGFNELGYGAGNLPVEPAAVAVAGLAEATAVSTGERHTCALRGDQRVLCWGANDAGQLGDGSTTDRTTPEYVKTKPGAVAVASGRAHACLLLGGGAVRCWGANSSGQIGDGEGDDALFPVDVGGLTDATALVAGSDHTCALREGGTVVCWGSNKHGQLGSGDGQNAAHPKAVLGLEGVVTLWSGAAHTCAGDSDGAVHCWGANESGQIDPSKPANVGSPTKALGLDGSVSLACGEAVTCGIDADGAMRCLGLTGQPTDGRAGGGEGGDDGPKAIQWQKPAPVVVDAGPTAGDASTPDDAGTTVDGTLVDSGDASDASETSDASDAADTIATIDAISDSVGPDPGAGTCKASADCGADGDGGLVCGSLPSSVETGVGVCTLPADSACVELEGTPVVELGGEGEACRLQCIDGVCFEKLGDGHGGTLKFTCVGGFCGFY